MSTPAVTRNDYKADARAQAECIERTPAIFHLLSLSTELSLRCQREGGEVGYRLALELENLDGALAALQYAGTEVSTEGMLDALRELHRVAKDLHDSLRPAVAA